MWVCLGSAVGGGARYLLSGSMLKLLGGAFPFGTLAVNLIGSFLVAGLMYIAMNGTAMSETTRLMLTAGVLGGFTTYSSFSYETMRCLQAGDWGISVANVVATVVGCLATCFLGWAVARWLVAS